MHDDTYHGRPAAIGAMFCRQVRKTLIDRKDRRSTTAPGAIVAVITLAVINAGYAADASPAQSTLPRAVVETPVGIEGVYLLRYRGPRLEALPVDQQAAIIVRIDNVVRDQLSDIYELRFIGQTAGTYDLRDYLHRVDGSPLNGVEPLLIAVHSSLPADHSGQLEAVVHPPLPRWWRYRVIAWTVGLLWLIPLLVWGWRRLRGRPRVRAAAGQPSPLTLADRIRPLAVRAMAGQLDQQEKARLERMLIQHWRHRLDLDQCSTVTALQQLRRHDVAGRLLRQLDHWLHRPPTVENVDLDELLAPYCQRDGD